MSRITYVNGRYLPHARANVHIEDRGYQFSDGVYEVIAICNGKYIDFDRHLKRLWRSLAALDIDKPMSKSAFHQVLANVVRLNRIRDGMAYIQVTRGVAKREHTYKSDTMPSLVITAGRGLWKTDMIAKDGAKVITYPEQRWARRDIKSVSLLANVLAAQAAKNAGAMEAWLLEPDGTVTEGTSSTAWIVTQKGTVVTRPFSQNILPGVTRIAVENLMTRQGLRLEERTFHISEVARAREAFMTSATKFVMPVIRVDDTVIGDGKPGQTAIALRQLYVDMMRAA